jgi:hypothetical protein
VVHFEDWGTRSVRWAGIRSERVDVNGTDVRLPRADAGRQAADDAPVHGRVSERADRHTRPT